MPVKHAIFSFFFFLFITSAFLVSGQESSRTRDKDQLKKNRSDPWAEEETQEKKVRRWEFAINLGAYFPNKYPANYYNGMPSNRNTLNYVFSNKYWYFDIKQALGASDTVLINDYPRDMHYQISMMGGMFVRFNFNRKHGIFLEGNYTRLKAEDVVTLEVDPKPYLTYPDLRLQPILGKEERVIFNLGYQYSFPFESSIYLFVQGGFTMSYTHVLSSVVLIGDREYNLINIYGDIGYVPGGNNQEFFVSQHGFGYGGFAGVGLGVPLTEMFGIEPGFFAQYYPVNLEGYPMWEPSFGAYFRILLGVGNSGEE